MERLLTIGRVARATGMPARTIRYYEETGVLPPAGRTASGYRRYDELAIQRIRFIRRARALGLPLRDLKVLGVTPSGGPAPLRPRLLALVREHLSVVRGEIAELGRLAAELEDVLRRPRPSAGERGATGCRCLEVERGRAAATGSDGGA
jgi:DNA-binding transcriptional MerR regulator